MRKRLRKKLRRGEYREFGFDLDWKFSSGVTVAVADDFWNDLIDLVEARALILGGGGDQAGGTAFITRDWAPGAVAGDREAVLSWARQQSIVTKVTAGPLVDAWAW